MKKKSDVHKMISLCTLGRRGEAMKCLGCNASSWSLAEIPHEITVDDTIAYVTSEMLLCNYCGQTSADDKMMQKLVKEWIEAARNQMNLPKRSKE